ncbi:hypothetical protein GQ54DRAFT_309239, partial [Martensiomyces pterosporus]
DTNTKSPVLPTAAKKPSASSASAAGPKTSLRLPKTTAKKTLVGEATSGPKRKGLGAMKLGGGSSRKPIDDIF